MNSNAQLGFARLLCGCAVAGFVTALVVSAAVASDGSEDTANTQKDLGWVEKRIAEWEPTKKETAFEEIGWVDSLLEAERLAKEHRRGILLFTYDGASLAGYRC